MKTRGKITLTLILGFIGVMLFAAQGVRWSQIDEQDIKNEQVYGKELTFKEVIALYPESKPDKDYEYCEELNLQYSRVRGFFPFTELRVDTLSKVLHGTKTN